MKRTKVVFILLLVLFIACISVTQVSAHTVELDPDSLISLPFLVTNGKGKITIKNSVTGYKLYYQAVEIPNSDYTKIQKLETDGEKELDKLDQDLDKLDADCNNLKAATTEAFDAWQAKIDSSASEDEQTTAKTAYETAKTNYENKIKEYNEKVGEYNTKSKEITSQVNELTPGYDDSKWIETNDGSFLVDRESFSGSKAFAIWVKLVDSEGNTHYDEGTYTMSGTKVDEIAVKGISLDKSEVTIKKGSSYTLKPTITPENATNKLIVWSSEDEDIAKVENGKITAVSVGTTTITAKTSDGNYTATCKVTVTQSTTTTNKKTTTVKTTDTKTETQKETQKKAETDNTVANGKIPQTGSHAYIIIGAVLALGVIGFITYKKVKYLNFK